MRTHSRSSNPTVATLLLCCAAPGVFLLAGCSLDRPEYDTPESKKRAVYGTPPPAKDTDAQEVGEKARVEATAPTKPVTEPQQERALQPSPSGYSAENRPLRATKPAPVTTRRVGDPGELSEIAKAPPAVVSIAGDTRGPNRLLAEIESVVRGWADSLRTGNLDRHVAFYAPRLDRFFTKSDVTRQEVLDEKRRMMARYPQVKRYDLKELEVTERNNGSVAVAEFRKDWEMQGQSAFAGAERQRLTFRNIEGSWKITSEEELKVYWVRRR